MIAYSIFFCLILAASGFLLVRWFALTEFGTKSLDSAVRRPNFMPYYFPFAILFGWLVLSALGSGVAESLTSDLMDWRQKFANYSVFFAIEIAAMVFIVKSANLYFENGLAGFGLRIKGIFQDFAAAVVTFITVWPFVMIALAMVVYIGKLIVGPQFDMQKNEGLEVLLGYSQTSLRILMILFAAVLTPIFEELIFRGLLQTHLRENLGYGPWKSIFFVSAIFAALHPLMHFPAIFILSLAMGYVYEKSGSLFRSIFIHTLFNSTSIAFALMSN